MQHDRGITLIELVVAMALFALVATMSLQALNGMLRSREQLTDLSEETAELSLTLTLLRHDLAAAVPIPFMTPAGIPESVLGTAAPGPRLALSLGGQAGPETPNFMGFHRAEWRFDPSGQRLMRRIWPVLQPAGQGQAEPETEMLVGVSRFGIRLYEEGTGWLDWSDLPPDRIRSRLPDAIEISLDTERYGRLTLLEAFR